MSPVPRPRRGEIWLVDFNPARGSEQAGRRPGLVIQNDAGNQSRNYPNTVILAISSRGRPIPLHVRVEPAETNGLSVTSWVKCEQILTVSKARLIGTQPVGRLTAQQIQEVELAVKRSLELP